MREISEGIFQFRYRQKPFDFKVTTDNSVFVKVELVGSTVVVPIPRGIKIFATSVAKGGDEFKLKYGLRLAIRKIKAKLLRHVAKELNAVVKPIFVFITDNARDPEFPPIESAVLNQNHLDVLAALSEKYVSDTRKRKKKKVKN